MCVKGRGLSESLPSEIVNVEFSTVGYRFFPFLFFFLGESFHEEDRLKKWEWGVESGEERKPGV